MQWSQPGEHREHHPQLGVLSASGGQEREPSGVHPGDVAGQSRPPQRIPERGLTGGRSGPRPGMDEQRRPTLLETPEERLQTSQGTDTRQSAGGKREPDATTIQSAIHVVGIGAVERYGRPHTERTAERQGAIVVGIDQGP
jgi:hypothetical protein